MMHQIITVKTPPVIAKDAPRRVPVPKLSLEDDAKRCNARLPRNVNTTEQTNRPKPPPDADKVKSARQRHANAARDIAALLAEGPKTRHEIRESIGLTDFVSKKVLVEMREAGLVRMSANGNYAKWSLR